MRNTLILVAVVTAVVFAFIVGRSVRDPSVYAQGATSTPVPEASGSTGGESSGPAGSGVSTDDSRDRVAEPNEDVNRADNPEVADAATAAEIEAETKCYESLEAQFQSNQFARVASPALDALVGDWYYTEDSVSPVSESRVAGKFFLALEKAQLLEGRPGERDDAGALKLFDEVARADAENSAPLVFKALVLKRAGREALSEAAMKQAAGRARFNSYVTDFSQKLFEQVKSPLDLVEAYSIYSRLPVPNYFELEKFLKGNPNSADKIASQMMREPNPDSRRFGELDWFPIEYAVGQKLVRAKNPNDPRPLAKDLLLRQGRWATGDSISRVFRHGCDLTKLSPAMSDLQEWLRKKRAS